MHWLEDEILMLTGSQKRSIVNLPGSAIDKIAYYDHPRH